MLNVLASKVTYLSILHTVVCDLFVLNICYVTSQQWL